MIFLFGWKWVHHSELERRVAVGDNSSVWAIPDIQDYLNLALESVVDVSGEDAVDRMRIVEADE